MANLRSVELLAANPWEFGWEALVAVGTLLLALATFSLVLRTGNLARWSEADVRAQWRPVILPASDSLTSAIVYDEGENSLRVRVQNAGRGPALYIRTHMEPGGVSPEHWSLGAVAAGDQRELMFRMAKIDSAIQLLFDYRDLANRTYSTSITVDVVNGDMSSTTSTCSKTTPSPSSGRRYTPSPAYVTSHRKLQRG